jgi:hypothetical protein
VRSLLDRDGVRLQFAGHETFPCRYGWLKKAYDSIASDTVDAEARRRAFVPEVAIAEFGVGKNMAASMRHWALACGVLESTGPAGRLGDLAPTSLGRLIFGGGDPYLEDPASLWTLHWRLASTPGRATAWYYAFNEFNESIFSKDILASRLTARVDDLRAAGRLGSSRIARATIDRDVECLLRTYVPRTGSRAGAEDSLECPFAELGLVTSLVGVNAVQFRRGPKPTLPDEVFAFALVEFWQSAFPTRGSLSLETVVHEPGSPGRVFLLDEESIAERLERLSDVSDGALSWDESTGLRQVTARVMIGTLAPETPLHSLYQAARMAA